MSDYGLDIWDSIPGRSKGYFFQPLHPDQLFGPPSLLSIGYPGLFSRVKAQLG
jgi:hypothetical protein